MVAILAMALAIEASYIGDDHGYTGYDLARSRFLSPTVNNLVHGTNSHVYPAYGTYEDYDNAIDHHDSYVSYIKFPNSLQTY